MKLQIRRKRGREESGLSGAEGVVKFPGCFLVISPHRLHRAGPVPLFLRHYVRTDNN